MSRFGLRTRNGVISSFIEGLVGTTIDVDAQAYFDRVTAAGGTLTTTEKDAIYVLVLSLKTNSLWTLMKVIYPMVGSSAAACAQNLKSSSFTATFSNCTFSGTGVTYGAAGQILVPLDLNTMNSINDISYGYYCRNDIESGGSFGWGVNSNINNEFWIEYTGGTIYGYLFDGANDGGIAGDSRGLNSISRIASNIKYIQKNSTINTYTSISSGSLLSRNFYFGRGHQGYETGRENAFGFIGNGLTSTNLTNLYTAVQTFQTSLSRQV